MVRLRMTRNVPATAAAAATVPPMTNRGMLSPGSSVVGVDGPFTVDEDAGELGSTGLRVPGASEPVEVPVDVEEFAAPLSVNEYEPLMG